MLFVGGLYPDVPDAAEYRPRHFRVPFGSATVPVPELTALPAVNFTPHAAAESVISGLDFTALDPAYLLTAYLPT